MPDSRYYDIHNIDGLLETYVYIDSLYIRKIGILIVYYEESLRHIIMVSHDMTARYVSVGMVIIPGMYSEFIRKDIHFII